MVSVGDIDATTQSKSQMEKNKMGFYQLSFIQHLCSLTLLQDNLCNIIKSSMFVSKQTSAKSLLAFVLLLFFKRGSQLSSFLFLFVCLFVVAHLLAS